MGPDALSATTPSLITASRTARQLACSAGASLDASPALSLPRTALQAAQASLLPLPIHAWTCSCRFLDDSFFQAFFAFRWFCQLLLLGQVVDLPQRCACQVHTIV